MNAHRPVSVVLLLGTLCACAAIAAPVPAPGLRAKCDELLATWKPRFDEEKFTAVVAEPFVLAGDGGLARIEGYRDRTVLGAVRCLQKQFFQKHPTEPVLILLFETEGPYKRLARKWFNDENVSYYGYFRHDNVMLMNVGTGTGTLVHELTHALIKPDFPAVPSWFNEGLASLYEQCTYGADDTIRGLANWRLAGLQKTIKAEKLRPLSEMIADPKFYREDLVGLNYAHARYLTFYLQEQKLLETYYKAFRDNVKDDPTGLATLKRTVEPRSLDDFEKDWKTWVMTLAFGNNR